MTLKHLILAAGTFALCACSHTTQYTSGKDYLERYDKSAATLTSNTGSIDADIRNIAAIEPDLQFPARIGLARIEKGRLISIPQDESDAWTILHRRLGPSFGNFVPVSPLIASMVSKTDSTKYDHREVVNNIRRGSARQHLAADQSRNALQLADLSILGLFVLPSRNIKVDSTASAMLIDVRNGYPYGTASAFAERKAITTSIGSRGRKTFMFELRDITAQRMASR